MYVPEIIISMLAVVFITVIRPLFPNTHGISVLLDAFMACKAICVYDPALVGKPLIKRLEAVLSATIRILTTTILPITAYPPSEREQFVYDNPVLVNGLTKLLFSQI